MRNSSVLFIAGAHTDPATLQNLAGVSRDSSIHLSVLVIGALPSVPLHAYPVSPYGSFEIPAAWHELVGKTTQEVSDTADTLAEMLAAEQVEADVRILCAEQRSLQNSISRQALSADLVMPGQDLREDEGLFQSMLQAALFNTSTGVLVNGTEASRCLRPRRVFVAWSYAAQSGRAVRAALPILRGAEEVTLALFDSVMTEYGDGENPGSDVARWLTHHGCRITVQQFPTGGLDIAEAIQLRATEASSDVLVMGAYHHSRMREIIFGGTTRTMIEQTGLPVLLAH